MRVTARPPRDWWCTVSAVANAWQATEDGDCALCKGEFRAGFAVRWTSEGVAHLACEMADCGSTVDDGREVHMLIAAARCAACNGLIRRGERAAYSAIAQSFFCLSCRFHEAYTQ